MKHLTILIAVMFFSLTAEAVIVDFDTNTDFILGSEDYILAGDNGGTLTAGPAILKGYHYTSPWDYWGGFGVSNRTVVSPDDIYHQFTAITGGDRTTGYGAYAIGYEDWESGYGAIIEFVAPVDVHGAWFTNNVWAAEFMQDNYGGDDYFQVIVAAYGEGMTQLDSRIVDLTKVYSWEYYDLDFEGVKTLGFIIESNNFWTPYYFCMDDLSISMIPVIPEPGSAMILMIALSGFAGRMIFRLRRR